MAHISDFDHNLKKDREELQKAVNKLILDFEQKYYFEGIRLQITECTSQDDKNAVGGENNILNAYRNESMTTL